VPPILNVNPREVEALPLNGRQLSQLYLQAPGSVNSGSGTFGDIRFSGRAVQQNVIRYDGIEGSGIIDASPGNLNGEVPSPFRLQSSLENVQEFRVDSNNFPAEFGTGTGGQVSVVTKSGGNQFHGSLFEYLRNDALDAANFFDNIIGQKAPLRLNQFGGSVGGPIVRNKAFFFFSYEGYRLRAGVNSVEAVPGSASRICKAPFGTGTNDCVATAVNLLPAFRSPDAVIISTGSGSNIFDVAQLQANSTVNENSAALRLDYKLNNKHSAYFRSFRDQGSNDQPEGVTGRRVLIKAVPQNGVLAVQSLLTPTLLNEFKLGYNSAYTRINGQAPTINGFDLSSAVINISGNTANFARPGREVQRARRFRVVWFAQTARRTVVVSRTREFRTEIFNIFNFTNFAVPSTTLNNALPTISSAGVVGTTNLQPGNGFTQSQAGGTFGLLRQTVERTVGLGTNRQIQFALRLNF
jgi:hypothetical protein